jgi:hypothetical protein
MEVDVPDIQARVRREHLVSLLPYAGCPDDLRAAGREARLVRVVGPDVLNPNRNRVRHDTIS